MRTLKPPTFFIQANTKLAEILKEEAPEEEQDTAISKDAEIDELLGEVQDSVDTQAASPLFSIFYPNIPQNAQQRSSAIGYASVSDTATVNKYLSMKDIRALLPAEMTYAKFLWDAKPIKDSEVINLYAIKSNRADEAPINGDVVTDASQVFDQLGINPEVTMAMNSTGTKQWARMTEENVGKFIAVVLDNLVYSAPNVNGPIPNGRTSISGQFTIDEAQDLANALKSGKLPAGARIIESSVVGPSLGQESINNSTIAFIIALVFVLIWMIFYYGKAGIFADIALVLNILIHLWCLNGF